jgi:hypothetical protein
MKATRDHKSIGGKHVISVKRDGQDSGDDIHPVQLRDIPRSHVASASATRRSGVSSPVASCAPTVSVANFASAIKSTCVILSSSANDTMPPCMKHIPSLYTVNELTCNTGIALSRIVHYIPIVSRRRHSCPPNPRHEARFQPSRI